MTLTIGVDVGGTKIAAGVVDESGTVLAQERADTPATDVDAVARAIVDIVTGFTKSYEVEAVGIGAAGFVGADRSTVVHAANVAWRDEPLKQRLEQLIGLPVVVENDANAAAWAEFCHGAGADVADLLCITVGTGIGGGIVLAGQLYRGAAGGAAEIGHMRVIPNGLPCKCGNQGCWEMYGSGRALVRDAQDAVRSGSPRADALVQRCSGQPDELTGPMVTAAAADGDELSKELVDNLGRWVGEGIASLVAVLDPAVVVVGGGVAETGDLLLRPAREAMASNLSGRSHRPGVELRPAELGNLAGLIGSADLARER